MAEIADAFETIFRNRLIDGVPASGGSNPSMAEARALGAMLEGHIRQMLAAELPGGPGAMGGQRLFAVAVNGAEDGYEYLSVGALQCACPSWKYILLDTPGDGTWTVPADWSDTNVVYAIGGGSSGNNFGFPTQAKSGGGGAFSQADDVTGLLPGDMVDYHVGAGGQFDPAQSLTQYSGEDSWFGDSNTALPACLCLARGASGFFGGNAGSSKGSVKYAGGDGGSNAGLAAGPGIGAGGAGGLNSAGIAGDSVLGDGGAGNGGVGGAGGQQVYSPPISDRNGFPGPNIIAALAGSGGGGGSAASNLSPNVGLAGNGGLYGGGGGMGAPSVFSGVSGDGAQGCIVIGWLGDLNT